MKSSIGQESSTMRERVKELITNGVYSQHDLFALTYPTYRGHYARLRDIISEVKNG